MIVLDLASWDLIISVDKTGEDKWTGNSRRFEDAPPSHGTTFAGIGRNPGSTATASSLVASREITESVNFAEALKVAPAVMCHGSISKIVFRTCAACSFEPQSSHV